MAGKKNLYPISINAMAFALSALITCIVTIAFKEPLPIPEIAVVIMALFSIMPSAMFLASLMLIRSRQIRLVVRLWAPIVVGCIYFLIAFPLGELLPEWMQSSLFGETLDHSTLVSIIYPVVASEVLVRVQRRWLHGCCQHCGYNISFSKERCPECGKPLESIE